MHLLPNKRGDTTRYPCPGNLTERRGVCLHSLPTLRLSAPHAAVMGCESMVFQSPASLYIRALEITQIIGGLVFGVLEFKDVHLKYSKFNPKGSPSAFHLPSRIGNLIFYTPALVIASLFLYCKLDWPNAAILLQKLGLLELSLNLRLHQQAHIRLLILAAAIAIHFLKRDFEVLFIHRYSGGMAIDSAALISFSYAYTSANLLYVLHVSEDLRPPSVNLMPLGVFLFIVGIVGNFYHHYLLSRLRKNGEKGYRIPQGGLFGLVVGPHYLFEILDYAGIALISQTVYGFCAFAMVFSYLLGRSLATRAWYVQKFEGFPKHRKALIPFLI